MFRYNTTFFSIFLFFISHNVQGQCASINITAQQEYDLTSSLNVFVDKQGKFNFSEIKLLKPENFNTTQVDLHKLEQKFVYWFKVSIANNYTYDSEWILDFGEASIIEVYIQDGLSNKKKICGNFAKIDSSDNLSLPNCIYFSLNRNTTSYEIYFRAENKNDEDFFIAPKLIPALQWHRNNESGLILLGLFIGLFCIVALYNLIFGLYTNRGAQIYFAIFHFLLMLYVFSISKFSHGLLYNYYPNLRPIIIVLSIGLLPLLHLLFIRTFIKANIQCPRWHKYAQIVLRTNEVIILLIIIFFFVFNSLNLAKYFAFANLSVHLILMSLLFLKFFKKFTLTNVFIIIGVVFIAIGSTISSIYFIFNFESAWEQPELNFLVVGALIHLVFITLAMAAKVRKNNTEKEEMLRKNIEQQKINEDLQQIKNRELEEAVQERTSFIEMQKQELIRKNEEIAGNQRAIFIKSENIRKANEALTTSLHYARKIQQQLLGSESEMLADFADGFIISKPRDIVSGDFFWYCKKNDDKIIILADCTGHGVSAAFMTIIGNDYLNEIILKEQIIDPSNILKNLDAKVIDTFKRNGEAEKLYDGMDIAVLRVNEKMKKIYFSSAKLALYHFHDNELYVKKGSLSWIGANWISSIKEFEQHEIDYNSNDIIYLCSDGFQDQLGGNQRKKFLTINFRALLQNIFLLSLERQKELLINAFKSWKGDNDQTDDILVIGLKL